jgi:hypothetical protein
MKIKRNGAIFEFILRIGTCYFQKRKLRTTQQVWINKEEPKTMSNSGENYEFF